MTNEKQILTNVVTCTIDEEKFDRDFDIFQITTEKPYIPYGSRLLDSVFGAQGLKAFSFSYDRGRSAFALFHKKDWVGEQRIIDELRKQGEDDTLTVHNISCGETKKYILRRLLLNSLANYPLERHRFNNLSGKLYIADDPKKNEIVAVEIGFDYRSCLNVKAVKFANAKRHRYEFDRAKEKGDPYYKLEGFNNSLVRVYDPDDVEHIYFKKGVGKSKASLTFLNLTKHGDEDKDKVTYMYDVLGLLNERFEEYLVKPFAFWPRKIKEEKDSYKEDDKPGKFEGNVAIAYTDLEKIKINVVSLIEDDPEIDKNLSFFIEKIQKRIAKLVGGKTANIQRSERIDDKAYNLVLLHRKDYYAKEKLPDPYLELNRIDQVIQVITKEDLLDKANNEKKEMKSEILTILKEMIIKGDFVFNKKITLTKWESPWPEGDCLFCERSTEKIDKDTLYFVKIAPDGSLERYHRKFGTLGPIPHEYVELCYAMENLPDYRQGIMNPKGEIILIKPEDMMVVPTEQALKETSKNKEISEECRRGLYGINFYETDDYPNTILYSVAPPRSHMKFVLERGVQIYSVKAFEQSENFIEKLLDTFLVPFVRLNSYTILPYPFKYVRESREMEKSLLERMETKRKGKK